MEYCSISTQDCHKSVIVFYVHTQPFWVHTTQITTATTQWVVLHNNQEAGRMYVNFVEWRLCILAILVLRTCSSPL